ncbi:MAG: F0F1 ATP synthase subunit delta [Candidatus Nomurabacteria bacterium]|nr:F0F1 ATP synthase subunit delta [Candidatus Nomurabacteria bacterium]
MTFDSETIAKSLIAMLSQGKNPVDVAKHLESFIKKHSLAGQIPSIVNYLDVFDGRAKSLDTLKIVGGNKLSNKNLERIKNITGAEIGTQTEINTDRKLMGGFIATYNNVRYDASVKGQIEKLQEALLTNGN